MTTPFGSGRPIDFSQRDHRRLIGVLGLLLPLLLYVMAGIRPMGLQDIPRWGLLSSVSDYYYTGAVAVFVGILFALSLFLFTYQGYEGVSADRWLGRIAGAAALGVALFPCEPLADSFRPLWWKEPFAFVHYGSAVILFISFILFAIWLFRKTSGSRDADKRMRDHLCLICGIAMIIAVLWAGSSMFTRAPIFLPESIAIVGFAFSWLVKGEAPVVADGVRFLSRRMIRVGAGPAPARKAS